MGPQVIGSHFGRGTSGGGYSPPPPMGYQWDTLGKQAVRILLECFLVAACFLIFRHDCVQTTWENIPIDGNHHLNEN